MKKLMVIAICLLSFQFVDAQVKFGVRAGMSTSDINPDQLLIGSADEAEQLGISVSEANYGIHLGFVLQAQLGNFFIQPEVLFNSNSVDFAVQDFSTSDAFTTIKNESYQHLDIPIMMGFKFGPLRLQAGPVSHVFINSSSELFDLSEYDQKFDDMTWGWQAGVGLDFWKIMLDFKYEGNFNKFGDHMNFAGNQYNFDQAPGRMVATVGITF